MCSALNGKKEYLKAEVGDEEKWDFLNFAEAWTPSDTMKGDTEDDKDGIFFSHVRKDFILYKVIFFYRRRRFCISLLVLYILIFWDIKNKCAMEMHRNENSLLKPNKMKHWAKGRIPTTFFPPCVFQQTIALNKLNMQLPLHKLNSQNVLFTVLFLLLKEKIYYKTTI